MKRGTKILLSVIAIIILLAIGAWQFLKKSNDVSADEPAASGEEAADVEEGSPMVSIDDGVTVVNPDQTLTYTMKINYKKMMETLVGHASPTEQEVLKWVTDNSKDKLYVNAWLANGKNSDGKYLLKNPNFSIQIPDPKFPLSEVSYTATAKVPKDIALAKNNLISSVRLVRRPCHKATLQEIRLAPSNYARYAVGNLFFCPANAKVRLGESVDNDTISYKENTTDLAITDYKISYSNVSAGDSTTFTVQYKNQGTQIAGVTKLKIRYPEGTFSLQDHSDELPAKETIEGKKYDVYYINIGNMLPTVNGNTAVNTDAATLNTLREALQRALQNNSNATLVAKINAVLAIVNQYDANNANVDLNATQIEAIRSAANSAYQYALQQYTLRLLSRINFSATDLASLNTVLQSIQNLNGAVNAPSQPLEIMYHAKAQVQARDLTPVAAYVELITDSTDSNPSNNSATINAMIISPQATTPPASTK